MGPGAGIRGRPSGGDVGIGGWGILLLFVGVVLGTPGTDAHAQPGRQAGGGETGLVRGEIYDSLQLQPLADARVVLWDTRHVTVTDAEGRFRIPGVTAGRYTLLYFHPIFQEFGISAATEAVAVAAGEEVEMELSTPSRFRVMEGYCQAEAGPDGGGMIGGQVRDLQSGIPLPGVRVRFRWNDPGSDEWTEAESLTDRLGWYSHCRLPAGKTVVVTAEFFDRQGPRREARATMGSGVRVDLGVGHLQPSEVRGTVREFPSDEAVSGAVVELEGAEIRTSTDDDGRFRLSDVSPGEHTLRVEHLAYGVRRHALEVGSDSRVTIEVNLRPQAIELGPLTVRVEPLDDEAVRTRGGRLISAEEIERVRHRSHTVADLVQNQNLTGVVVLREGAAGVCIGIMPGQARMVRGDCEPLLIFVDNVRMGSSMRAATLPAEMVDHMIYYRPVEAAALFGLGAGNGVLMIFTRRGGGEEPAGKDPARDPDRRPW